jgi:hypothetical protein
MPQTWKSMRSSASAAGSLGVNEKSLATMLVFITESEAPPNASNAQSTATNDINGVNRTQY